MFCTANEDGLHFDHNGRIHLLAAVASGRSALDRLAAEMRASGAIFTACYDPDPAATLAGPLSAAFDSAKMGLRLYLAGPKCFLTSAQAIAASFGIGPGEIQMQCTEAPARSVYCVHCKAISQQVTTAFHTCASCGIRLGVREHFSPRLGCYLGVSL